MTTDAEEWVENREKKLRANYEKNKEEHISYYREMDDDQLLEEVARKFPGCPDEICLACHENEALINELRRRMGEK